MSGDKPVKRAGKRPGRKPSKMDVKAKLERSRQSARECRARKKLRYQYLEELVASREKAIFSLREELEMSKRMCNQLDKGIVPEALVKLLASRQVQSAGRQQPQSQATLAYASQRTYSQSSGATRCSAPSSSAQQLPSVINEYQPSSSSRSLLFQNSFPPTVYRDSVGVPPYLSVGSSDTTGISVCQDLGITSSRAGLGTKWTDSLQPGASVSGSLFSGGLGSGVGGSSGGAGWVDYSPASTLGTLQSAGSSSNLSTASWASSVSEGCSVMTPFASSSDSQGFSCAAPSTSGNVAPTNVPLTSMAFQMAPQSSGNVAPMNVPQTSMGFQTVSQSSGNVAPMNVPQTSMGFQAVSQSSGNVAPMNVPQTSMGFQTVSQSSGNVAPMNVPQTSMGFQTVSQSSGNVAPTSVPLTSTAYQTSSQTPSQTPSSASVSTEDAKLVSILNYLTEDAPLPGVNQGGDVSSPQFGATASTSEAGGFGSTPMAASAEGEEGDLGIMKSVVDDLEAAGKIKSYDAFLELADIVLSTPETVSTPQVTYSSAGPGRAGTGESSEEDTQTPSWLAHWKN